MNAQTSFGDWSAWAGPFVELQQINQAATERVIRECISFYSDTAANTVKCTQTMQRVNSPEDFFNTQMKLLSQWGEKNLEFMQNIFQIYQDVLSDQGRWTQEKVSTAVKNAGRAASSVKRQAEEH